MSKVEILVPVLGESVTEATVAKWHKNPGDIVQKDEVVVELETDKITLEVDDILTAILQTFGFVINSLV